MKKNIQISIPTPCHENWDAMTTTDKGRFCASCQKNVVDFTKSSDREIASVFKTDKNTCGRFLNSQLKRELVIPKEKSSLWVAASAAIVSFLTIGNGIASAQASVKTEQAENKTDDIKSEVNKTITVNGIVTDEAGLTIPSVNIIIKGTKNGVQTDLEGKYSIEAAQNDTLIINYIGFIEQTLLVTNDIQTYNIVMIEDVILAEDVVAGMPAYQSNRTFFGRIFHSIGKWFR